MKNYFLLFLTILISTTILHSQFLESITGPPDGTVSCIIADSNGNVYAGTYDCGFFCSANRGISWLRRETALQSHMFISLALSSSGVLFAVTQNISSYDEHCIVYRSSDGGLSWTSVLTIGSRDYHYLSQNGIAITSQGDILVASGQISKPGIYRSEDNGESWSLLNNGILANFEIMSVTTSPSGDIYALGEGVNGVGSGIYKSTNSGDSWDFLYGFSVPVGITINNLGSIFVSDINYHLIYRSTNNGLNWSTVLSVTSNSLTSTADGSVLVGTNSNILRSTNNGTNWVPVRSTNSEIHALYTDKKGYVYAGAWHEGVVLSSDSGIHWSVTPFPGAKISALLVSPNGYIFAGTDQILYRSSAGLIFRSTNGGQNWTEVFRQIPYTVTSFAITPSGSIMAGFSGAGLFQSTDQGDSWSSIGIPNSNINSISIDSNGYYFVGTSDGIYRSTNNGNSWSQRLPGADINATFALIPNLILASSWGGYYGIYRSTDIGSTWQNVDANASLGGSFSFILNDAIYFSRAGAVVRSVDKGISWQEVFNFKNYSFSEMVSNNSNQVFLGLQRSIGERGLFYDGQLFRKISKRENWELLYNSSIGLSSIALDSAGYLFVGTSGNGILRSISSTRIPIININKQIIDFGEIQINKNKDTIVTIMNTGEDTLKITSITSSNNYFSMRPAKLNIPPGQNTIDTICYTPGSFGTQNGLILFFSNDATTPDTLNVKGRCPTPTVYFYPMKVSFGDVGIYDTAITILRITNSSVNALNIDSIFTNSTRITYLSSSSQVTISDTVTISIKFNPVTFGVFSDTIYLRNNSNISLVKIPLIGNTPNSIISIYPSSIKFGTVCKDSSRQLLFTITNPSISVLLIDSFWTKTKYFNISQMLAFGQIRKGDSTNVTIRFTPDSARSFMDTMFVSNNSLVSPFKVPLSGNGALTSITFRDDIFPTTYELNQNYPNPFNPSTTIRYGLPSSSRVSLKIYNVLGQQIDDLVSTEQTAGWYEMTWSGNISSGLYFYRIDAVSTADPNRRFTQLKKMMLLK